MGSEKKTGLILKKQMINYLRHKKLLTIYLRYKNGRFLTYEHVRDELWYANSPEAHMRRDDENEDENDLHLK